MAGCNHKWGEWNSEPVLYTRTARLDGGEIRTCELCGTAKFRNFKASERPAAMTPVVSLYGFPFDGNGRIGLKRRPLTEKNNPGEYELLGGATRAVRMAKAKDERIIGEELNSIIKEKIDLDVEATQMPAMYPAVLGGGGDWAFGVHVTIIGGEIDELFYFSPEEIEALADGEIGNRILSGRGKRMHQLILVGLAEFSCNFQYRISASQQLLHRYSEE